MPLFGRSLSSWALLAPSRMVILAQLKMFISFCVLVVVQAGVSACVATSLLVAFGALTLGDPFAVAFRIRHTIANVRLIRSDAEVRSAFVEAVLASVLSIRAMWVPYFIGYLVVMVLFTGFLIFLLALATFPMLVRLLVFSRLFARQIDPVFSEWWTSFWSLGRTWYECLVGGHVMLFAVAPVSWNRFLDLCAERNQERPFTETLQDCLSSANRFDADFWIVASGNSVFNHFRWSRLREQGLRLWLYKLHTWFVTTKVPVSCRLCTEAEFDAAPNNLLMPWPGVTIVQGHNLGDYYAFALCRREHSNVEYKCLVKVQNGALPRERLDNMTFLAVCVGMSHVILFPFWEPPEQPVDVDEPLDARGDVAPDVPIVDSDDEIVVRRVVRRRDDPRAYRAEVVESQWMSDGIHIICWEYGSDDDSGMSSYEDPPPELPADWHEDASEFSGDESQVESLQTDPDHFKVSDQVDVDDIASDELEQVVKEREWDEWYGLPSDDDGSANGASLVVTLGAVTDDDADDGDLDSAGSVVPPPPPLRRQSVARVVVEYTAESASVQRMECVGYNWPRGSVQFQTAEDILCSISELFCCGCNRVSETASQRLEARGDVAWSSLVMGMVDAVQAQMASDPDEVVRLVAYAAGLLKCDGLVSAAILTVASYPAILRPLLHMVPSGSTITDIAQAIFDDPDEFVAKGDASMLVSQLRQEFVFKVLSNGVFGSIITQLPERVQTEIRRLTSATGTPLGLAFSVLSSCQRMHAHVRYYLDGDLGAYLGRLDAYSALVFRHGSLESELSISGFKGYYLTRVEDLINDAKRLLIKLSRGDPDFARVEAIRVELLSWRQQINSRAASGRLPFGVMIVGAPRSGKSEFCDVEAPVILAGVLGKTVADLNIGRPRSSDKFDTELKPVTHMLAYHDAAKDAIVQFRRDALLQIFDLLGGQSIALTKAELSEKGVYMAPPRMVLFTSNDMAMRVDDGKVFNNHDALAARFPYGVQYLWDGNEVTDPMRMRVRYNIGVFDPELYRTPGRIPYNFDAPGCGKHLTKDEFLRKFRDLFIEHERRADAYAAQRDLVGAQCEKCLSLKSMCTCVDEDLLVARGESVTLELALPLTIQLYLYGVVLVPIVACFFKVLGYYAAFVGSQRILDWMCVQGSVARVALMRDGLRGVHFVRDYVARVPTAARTAVEQYKRLRFIRECGKTVAALSAAAIFTVGAGMFWRYMQAADDVEARADGTDDGTTDATPPMGVRVPPAEEFEVEKCVKRVQVGKLRMNGVALDDRTLMIPGHLLGKEYKRPLPAACAGVKNFVAYPECVVRPLDGSDVALLFTNRRFGSKGVKFREFDGQGPWYVSGRTPDGQLHRHEVLTFERPSLGLKYRDTAHVGDNWVIDAERVLRLMAATPHGSCGSILHDGENVAGIIVAGTSGVKAPVTVILLFRPAGPMPFDVSHSDVPLIDPQDDPLAALETRGQVVTERNAKSMFNYPGVAEHWSYRGSVVDPSVTRPRHVRTMGPDVEALEALSGVPSATLAEATGASGLVEGVDHPVAPVEHMFDAHRRAQNLPAPILDSDSLEEVKQYIAEVVPMMELPFKGPLSTEVAILGDGDQIAKMANDKSAGFPDGAKRDYMVVDEAGTRIVPSVGLLARVDAEYDELVLKGGWLGCALYRPFPKQGEVLPYKKVVEGRSRIIMNKLGLVSSIVTRRIMLPVLLNIVSARKIFGILVGISATNPRHVEALASDVFFGDPKYQNLAGDHAKLDLHQRFRIAVIVMAIYARVARAMNYTPGEIRAVKVVAGQWLFPHFVYRGDVWTSNGDIWGSGALGTDVFQSLTTWLLHLVSTVFHLRSRGFKGDALVRELHSRRDLDGVRVYGDDNYRNSWEGDDCPTGEFIAGVTLACGYEMTDAVDKTLPPRPSPVVSILKRTIAKVDLCGQEALTMPLDVRSIVKSLYYPKKGLDGKYDVEIYAASLRNANREIFLHGAAEFERWHPVLRSCWERCGVSGSFESGAELRVSYFSGEYSTWDSGGQLKN